MRATVTPGRLAAEMEPQAAELLRRLDAHNRAATALAFLLLALLVLALAGRSRDEPSVPRCGCFERLAGAGPPAACAPRLLLGCRRGVQRGRLRVPRVAGPAPLRPPTGGKRRRLAAARSPTPLRARLPHPCLPNRPPPAACACKSRRWCLPRWCWRRAGMPPAAAAQPPRRPCSSRSHCPATSAAMCSGRATLQPPSPTASTSSPTSSA